MQVSPVQTASQVTPDPGVQLEQLARNLAENHTGVTKSRPQDALLKKYLPGWKQTLQAAYKHFRALSLKDPVISRASEWMLDNFYIIEQTFQQINEDLPKNYYNQLPKLNGTTLKGYPRIYALARELVNYNQGQVDLAQVVNFVHEYQQISPLMVGELWAFPSMLRIGVVEQLATVLSTITEIDAPESMNAQSILPLSPSLPNDTIVANCFLSMRLLSTTDWKEFFEQISRIEQILRDDPMGIYADMDFNTRNIYRSVVEEMARNSDQDEEAVARVAIEFARKAYDNSQASLKIPDKKIHVGYYLIGAGLSELEITIGYHPHLKARLNHWVHNHPTFTYLGSISILSLLIVVGLLAYTLFSKSSPAQFFLVALLGCGLAMDASINLVNWIVTHQITPRTLPRMDYSEGIPSEYRTMVVIPTLLSSGSELNSLLQELELHFLRNPDPQLSFALLTDFIDAPSERMPEDDKLLALAIAGIENLNHKYEGASPYYLFHRQRVWNQSEGVWMGWERKRGKLVEFNRLVLNSDQTSYTTQVGDLSRLQAIKFVITLDADTSLPRGSAGRLVATLSHPLNRAEFSADGRSVVAGYTILQPRVEIKPTSANYSTFSRIFAGNTGFDLYTLAVSDVYQDLFGEGSYIGKGIYDVADFEKSLIGQVRDNTLLSHDLFEGISGRAALVTDILLYEEYPAGYLIYARRMNRWIRGDWQLMPWLLPIVKTERGYVPNRLSLINRWKIFDNLRRSLQSPTYLLFLTAGWLFLPGSALFWTLLILLTPAIPIAIQAIQNIKHNLGRLSLKRLFDPSRLPVMRLALLIFFLPYEALLSLAAIGITLIRLLVARRNLLQWTTAAHIARSFDINAKYKVWLEMAASLVFTALLGFAILLAKPSELWVAAPLLIAWTISPGIAYWISRPIVHKSAPLSESQHKQIQRVARRTWAFFEQFAGPDDHWLPPDHFQENPRGSVAHYTTPTNIGLFLLSILSAYDLGYLGLLELAVRLRSTFDSIDGLEHYRGHLLNWYDTQTLTPLPPRYVSTVDSGNLAASLIAFKQGCLALADAPVVGSQHWQGLLTLLDILTCALKDLEKNNPGSNSDTFVDDLDNICKRIADAQNQPEAWTNLLAWLMSDGRYLISRHLMELIGRDHPNLDQEALSDLQLYLDGLLHQLVSMQRNIKMLAPWLGSINQPPRLFMETGNPPLQAWQDFLESLPSEFPSLAEAASVYEGIKRALAQLQARLDSNPAPAHLLQEAFDWCRKLDEELVSSRLRTEGLLIGYRDLARQANGYVDAMDFKFLFDERRQVFYIGYNATTEKLDPNHYDLLASEARIASLIAIAKGDVPQSHWLHLGRPVTQVKGKQVLLSWSGTMFEYLMPALLTRNYEGTFLSESCYAAVDAQINYAQQKHSPWGMSESGYYAFDTNKNYQYRAFGVPDLGYKRDLSEDVVIAPYASLIGLSLRPQAVLANMEHLSRLNMLGRFGFYESIDYTKTRLPADQVHANVYSYMAHHQGMILLSLCNFLTNDVMVQRFHADERIQSVDLLLQEKIPQNPPIEYPHPDEPVELALGVHSVSSAPWRVPVDSPLPLVHVLSQGDASVLITNSGGGYSQWREFALTRWQSDTTLDNWGTWIYLQDHESGALWSTACQPIGCAPDHQEVLFSPHKVEFRRWDNGISLHTEITVGTDGVEIRRVSILNDSDRPRQLKLISYGEVVLAGQATDRRHPAFNKLFIENEYLPRENILLFHRRPRSTDEKPVVLAHALVTETGLRMTGDYKSDRAQFLGRSQITRSPPRFERTIRDFSKTRPASWFMQGTNHSPSNSTGGTLDPIFSLAQEIDLKPHVTTRITFLTAAAPSRSEVLECINRYQSPQKISRAFDESRVRSEREILEMGLNASSIENIQRILSALLFPVGTLRAAPHILAQNEKGQSGLWAFGISGDYPILLVRIRDGESPLLPEALQAFNYWRSRHVTINLVILNEQDTGYSLDLHNAIHRQIERMGADASLNQRDGIFEVRSDQLQPADRIMFETVAGVILDEKGGTLADHALRLTAQPVRLPEFTPSFYPLRETEPTLPLQVPGDLLLDNGLGGFNHDGGANAVPDPSRGREYVIHLRPGQHTPHPWVNVIANPQFGFLVSEAGSGCTWAENSGENRLTPWHNDPVTDLPGEAIYLRDEETGQVWSPTPMPAGDETVHVIRHGAGYSIFESQSHGLNQNLRLFVAPDAPVKIAHLRLKNIWECPRRITVTYYAEWVLGTTRDTYQAHIMPEFDPDRHALLAANRYNSEFGERVAFLAANKKPHGVTADRTEFLGRLGSMRSPAALGRIGLASAVNAGLDPCAVIQLHVDLQPGAAEEVFFLIGEGANRAESLALINRVQAQGQVDSIWQAVHQQWDDILTTITVETPDSGMDLMLNRWLLYQTLSCRLWGRTGLYQSSGAFGFRDQLQDVLALQHTRPGLARAQILEAARHQFEAGDVLHWWNPPSGRGVRTRYSDDLLWLPFVTGEYVTATGDTSILLERIPFLKGEALKPDEIERYAQYEETTNAYSLYDHCRRALEKGAAMGSHGLPLMGAGDWNDGMNRVGVRGRGESVWLGWFLYATLKRFAPLVALMMDDPAPYLQRAERLSQAIEAHAWDGDWYLRAFHDDGSRLGSRENIECQIDSIAQSWAVLSGAADPARSVHAMESVSRLLVKRDEQMILLFTPPFDITASEPGYIKGYLPGVRENGGQYTHAAIWAAWAFAELGQGDRAFELFQMLNPINHTDTPEKAARYMVEPYVIAADIYSVPPHAGKGGWTWYTGSSGWMYRLGIEAILGISRVGRALNINPCIPRHWPGYKVNYRSGKTHYMVNVENPHKVNRGIQEVLLDGKPLPGSLIPLVEDGQAHEVRVVMGDSSGSTLPGERRDGQG
jgi:cyclic beta-1,2-glucan synthetase